MVLYFALELPPLPLQKREKKKCLYSCKSLAALTDIMSHKQMDALLTQGVSHA